jgi:hypothetical protein
MSPRIRALVLALLGAAPLLGAGGCAHAAPTPIPAALTSPFTGYRSAVYQDPQRWICRPDRPTDVCRGDLTATEITPDGRHVRRSRPPAAEPAVDCFYVYPTVDLGWLAGNHTDFRDTTPMTEVARAQAAAFTQACAVYAPLYRQVTIGTYGKRAPTGEPYFAVAESDVLDAFLHYMGQHNRGRKVALIGHSQGADMVVRLLRRLFDEDPAMRERLLVAMPIGMRVEVPAGRATGGTFSHIEPCRRDDQQGCVIAYRSHSAARPVDPGRWGPVAGRETVCVNPADVAGNTRRPLAGSAVPVTPRLRSRVPELRAVETPFVILGRLWSAQCVDGPRGYRYLAIAPAGLPGDTRRSPIDLNAWLWTRPMGLHLVDFHLPLGELVEQVRIRAAAVAPAAPRSSP